MTHDPDKRMLHAIIASRDDYFEVQLLELAVAVSARSVRDLYVELEHALVTEYEVAKAHGLTPFVRLAERASVDLQREYQDASFDNVRDLHLPAHVSEALAAVLHVPQPVLRLSSVNMAA